MHCYQSFREHYPYPQDTIPARRPLPSNSNGTNAIPGRHIFNQMELIDEKKLRTIFHGSDYLFRLGPALRWQATKVRGRHWLTWVYSLSRTSLAMGKEPYIKYDHNVWAFLDSLPPDCKMIFLKQNSMATLLYSNHYLLTPLPLGCGHT